MKKVISVVLLLAMALSLAACGGSKAPAAEPTAAPAEPAATAAPTAEPTAEPTEAPQSGPITFTDMTGREITIEKYPERIVAITASCGEILYAVGAGDKLVARGHYVDYPAEALELPDLGSGYDTNVEDIIAYKPDMVLIDTMAQTTEQIEAMEAAGITVVVTTEKGIDGIYEAVRLIGKAVGKEDNAEKVVSDMQARLAALGEKVAAMNISEEDRASVYFEVSPPYYGDIYAAGAGSYMDEIAQLLGLRNIFAEGGQWAKVSEEQIIQAAPDYMVSVTMYGDGYTSTQEEIMGRPGWENIPAVKNGNILLFSHDEMTRPAPRMVEAAEAFFDYVYGQTAAENAA